MKGSGLFILLFISQASVAQTVSADSVSLTVSTLIDQSYPLNQQIITRLAAFLKSKDESYTNNKYWLKSDFDNYTAPYADLAKIEEGRSGRWSYQPSLMEIVSTNRKGQKIVKLAFIGHNNETKENLIKAIYNLVATVTLDGVVFSKYLDYATKDWKEYRHGSLTYKIPPHKTPNEKEIARQSVDLSRLCRFLNTKSIPIRYYSCATPKEVFVLKGFDYHPMMYSHTAGGFAEDRNIILSGNNSEYCLHELTHLYIKRVFPAINSFFNEGFATFIGGSGKQRYRWHREKVKTFLAKNADFRFDEHTDPYEQLFFAHETSVPYLIGALVCERTLRLYGKEKLFALFRNKGSVFAALQSVGLTQENMTAELRKELSRPLTVDSPL